MDAQFRRWSRDGQLGDSKSSGERAGHLGRDLQLFADEKVARELRHPFARNRDLFDDDKSFSNSGMAVLPICCNAVKA